MAPLTSIFNVFLLLGCANGAFVPTASQRGARQTSSWIQPNPTTRELTHSGTRSTTTARNMMDGSSFTDAFASSMWLSTVDADIAKLSDNEFAPIFAGGILVMFGGVLSALIVGGILESKNNYAEIVADSYRQGDDNKDFWENLSEEEQKKMQDMLQKVKNANEGIRSDDTPLAEMAKAVAEKAPTKVEVPSEKKTEELDMFSDYAD